MLILSCPACAPKPTHLEHSRLPRIPHATLCLPLRLVPPPQLGPPLALPGRRLLLLAPAGVPRPRHPVACRKHGSIQGVSPLAAAAAALLLLLWLPSLERCAPLAALPCRCLVLLALASGPLATLCLRLLPPFGQVHGPAVTWAAGCLAGGLTLRLLPALPAAAWRPCRLAAPSARRQRALLCALQRGRHFGVQQGGRGGGV